MISIKGLPKECVLKALYDSSKVQGLGILDATDCEFEISEAIQLLKQRTYFDYLHGKVMKVDLSSDKEFDERLYDRDNGENAAKNALYLLKKAYIPIELKTKVLQSVIRMSHHEMLYDKRSKQGKKEFVLRQLATKIADIILKEELYDFTQEQDVNVDILIYKMKIIIQHYDFKEVD